MPQVQYEITLAGRADDAKVEDVQEAFAAGVKALRKAGVTVEGALVGNEQGEINPETGLASARVDVHDLAGSVD